MPQETILSCWDEFRARVLDPMHPGPVQRQETRRAFYAGAWSALNLLRSMDSTITDDEGAQYIDNLWQECLAFYEQLEKGKA
jgi:hypothetical protein